jgi:two-component system response regulator FixJ
MSRSDNVYVIDDDPAMRDSLDFLLGSAGFNVRVFESAVQFLLLHRLQAGGRKLPIVIMTGHGDIPLAVEAMKLGALDFLEKPFEDERLIGMINTALKQRLDEVQIGAATAELAARIATLSPRERQVLDGLVAGLSNKLIARDYGISPRTIEVYRANVMTKMQAGSISELVRLAMRGGLLKD